jgi:RES domain-containing protein
MIVYRQATFGNPLRTEPGRRAGRYHTGSETSPTQYLCLHPLGPFAEFIRGHSVRLPDQVLRVHERTWALQLEQDELLEVGFDNAHEFGLDAAALVDDDPTRCQELANELRAADIPGMVVPSAALPGTRNVVLFGPRVGSPYLLEPVSAIDVPASITAHDGRPIVSLLELVRFRGDTHAGLDAWQRGDHLEFDEPDWELAPEMR